MVVDDGTTFVCQYWMTSKLKLRCSNLVVYAFLFSMADEDGLIEVSQDCIASVCGIHNATVSKILSRLENMKLISSNEIEPNTMRKIKTYKIEYQDCFKDLGITSLGFDMTNQKSNNEDENKKVKDATKTGDDKVEETLCKFFLDEAKTFSLV